MTALARCWSAYVRSPAVWAFWILLVLYHADGRAHPESDCVPAPYAAWSLAQTGTLDVSRYPELQKYVGPSLCLRELPDGRVVSRYPPGSTLAVLPLVAPFVAFRTEPFGDATMHALGKAAAAIHVALAGALFLLLCRRLAPGAVWPAVVLFALGTCLYSVAAQAIWMHGPAVCYLTVALYLIVRFESRWWVAFLAGVCLGMAVLNRPTAAVFAVATGLALLLNRDRRVIAVTLGGLIPVAYLLWLNWAHFGSPLRGGYGAEVDQAPPPLWVGLGGLLVAPSRGLFVYSPALLLLPLGLFALRTPTSAQRPHRSLLLCWFLATVVTVGLYSRWHDWKGGWCYGPRFLCETLPILCLLFAVGVDRVRAKWFRVGVWGLVVLSVMIHALGIFGGRGYEDWQRRHDPITNPSDPDGRSLFDPTDTQIEAHARGLWNKLTGR